MAGRDGQGNTVNPSSKKRDRTIDDALFTMERLGAWLGGAIEDNAWEQAESAYQVAMLHGMLVYLRGQIDTFIALGGDEVGETVANLRATGAQNSADLSS
ncbi:MAG: hypothetical protein ABIQ99_10545 [Thermoflexales bacterium]